MKTVLGLVVLVCSICLPIQSSAQRKVSEVTLQFEGGLLDADGRIIPSSSLQLTVNIKAFMSRADQLAAGFSSSTIHDAHSGSATLLKEVSGQKLMIRMTADEWASKNSRTQSVVFRYNNDQDLKIGEYNCQSAEADLPSGTKLKVYYTRELEVENKSFEPLFEKLEGFPLQWELTQGQSTLKYKLVKIALNPIPISKFDLPKSGYRELTFEEAKKDTLG